MPRAQAGVVKYHYLKQPIASDTVTPPVQNTWYTVLDTTEDVRLLQVVCRQINDEVAAKDVEFRWTVDGIPMANVVSIPDTTWHWWYILEWGDSIWSTAVFYLAQRYAATRGQSVMIEMRMTSVPGTNQSLEGHVHYETLELT